MKVVFNAGIYDMCHQGHINLFKRMRQASDLTVAVIHDDQSCYDIKGKSPIQPLEKRIMNLLHTRLIDGIVITRHTDPWEAFESVIKRYGSDQLTYMRGDDVLEGFPGQWFLTQESIPITFVPYTKGISSTQLKEVLCS